MFLSPLFQESRFQPVLTVIVGFMIRSDMPCITSIIHDLALNPILYNSMEHFFRTDSWEWENLFLVMGERASYGKYMPCTKKWYGSQKVLPSRLLSTGISGTLWIYWPGMPQDSLPAVVHPGT